MRTSPATATTDATGLATFAALSIAQAGTYIAQAQAAGLASAQSRLIHDLGQYSRRPSRLPAEHRRARRSQRRSPKCLQATLTDAAGNPMAGVPVVFLAPLAGAGGTFGGATSVSVPTDQQGRAAAPFTANAYPGRLHGDRNHRGGHRPGSVRTGQSFDGAAESGVRAAAG